MSPILETRNLSKAFGNLRATQDVTLRFEPGGRYAIIGPNGAGKTTFFNLLAGNLIPDSGSILMSEHDVTRLQLSQRARLGIARSFQKNSLFLEMTVRESLAFACLLREGKTFMFWRTMRSLKAPYDEALSLWEVPSWPAHGEYASSTYFVTDDPEPRLEFISIEGEFSELAMFSDGMERLALDFLNKTASERFFDPMFAPLAQVGPGRDRALSASLRKYLDSSRVLERTDDDKSLVLARRVIPQ